MKVLATLVLFGILSVVAGFGVVYIYMQAWGHWYAPLVLLATWTLLGLGGASIFYRNEPVPKGYTPDENSVNDFCAQMKKLREQREVRV